MATTSATFTAANTATLRQTLNDVVQRLAVEGSEAAPPAVTIAGDTAGTVTISVAACQSNPAFSRVITATVV